MDPYNQKIISKNRFIREFNPQNSDLFVWHRDKKDRIVKVLSCDSWKLQIDNELPIALKTGFNYLIHKNTWHRIIAGKNNLKIEITELDEGKLK